MSNKINIFWFRRDLRIQDNAGLFYALADGLPVLPIFIFDPFILDKLEDKSDARVNFIHRQLSALDATFIDAGGNLEVYHSTPLEAFKNILEKYEVHSIFTNRDYEPYALERDTKIEQYAKTKGVGFYAFKDHVIFEKEEILSDSGSYYKVFTPYKNKWLTKYDQLVSTSFNSEIVLKKIAKSSHPFPSLTSLGFKASSVTIPQADFPIAIIKKYEESRNYPGIEGTTRLGIHLRHGTVSIRQAANLAKNNSATWLNELIWRDFYSMILSAFPQVAVSPFKSQYNLIPWRNDPAEFEQWCKGLTGYPIVDAGMRELNATGHMHNRVRMITASFLTKHLLIDWRWGEAYFASKLLDFDLASNNGGWQWAAGTGTDAQPYFRVFNPSSQVEKFDPKLVYIKKWIPEINEFNYPKPMVDHKFARERAIQTYKAALS